MNKTKTKITKSASAPVVERRQFYKDGKRSMSVLAITSIACLVVNIGLSMYVNSISSQNKYFATTNDGRLVKMIALNTPNQKDANVTAWAQEAIIDTFDMNFNNMKRRVNETSMRWFTSEGGSALVDALSNEGYFETILREQLIVSFAPTHTPVVVKKYLNRSTGKFTWNIQMEGLLSYRTSSFVKSDKVVISLEIQRVSLREDPKGMGISKIILKKKR